MTGHIHTGIVQAEAEATQESKGQEDEAAVSSYTSSGREAWQQFFEQPGQLARVVALELMAAKQAKTSAAYDSALHLYSAALRFLQQRCNLSAARTCFDFSSPLAPPDIVNAVVPNVAPAALTSTDTPLAAVALIATPTDETAQFVRVDAACWAFAYADCLSLYHELASCLFVSRGGGRQQCAQQRHVLHLHCADYSRLSYAVCCA